MIKMMMHGCNGKMGRMITEIVKGDENAVIAAGVDTYTEVPNEYPVFDSIEKCDSDADVVIDDAVDQLMRFGQKTQKFLITRRYNQDQVLPGDIERVKDLREVIERLTERNIHRI